MGDPGPATALDAMDSLNFPAKSFLGYTLDLTTVQLGDINEITNNIKTAQSYIGLGTGDTSPQTVFGGSWDVPSGAVVSTDVVSGTGQFNSYSSGSSAVSSLATDSSLGASYQGVSGDVSVSTVNSKQFSANSQYSLFVYESEDARAGFLNYVPNINNQNLGTFIGSLPPFDATNAAIVNQYWNVFKNSGSHIITTVVYGGRFYLKVAMTVSEESNFNEFQVDVKAKYQGILQASVDSGVTSTQQYSNFSSESEQVCAVTGGDPTVAGQIEAAPSGASTDSWTQWVNSVNAQTGPEVVSYVLQSVPDIMGQSSDPAVSGRQTDFQQALNYIIGLPYYTPCRLTVNTDYAGLVLTTTGFGCVVPAPGQSNSSDVSIAGQTVNFRSPNAVPVVGYNVDFYIINNGSPFTMKLTYGSQGQHFASFMINGKSYGAGDNPNRPGTFTGIAAFTDSQHIYVPDGWAYNAAS